MKITTDIRPKDNAVIFKIEGKIGGDDGFSLAEKIEPFILRRKYLIFDMKKVTFVNSAALGIFLNIFKYVESLDGIMVFTDLNNDIRKTFEYAKLAPIFNIADTYNSFFNNKYLFEASSQKHLQNLFSTDPLPVPLQDFLTVVNHGLYKSSDGLLVKVVSMAIDEVSCDPVVIFQYVSSNKNHLSVNRSMSFWNFVKEFKKSK